MKTQTSSTHIAAVLLVYVALFPLLSVSFTTQPPLSRKRLGNDPWHYSVLDRNNCRYENYFRYGTRNTIVLMGIRDFLSKRIGKSKRDDDGNEDEAEAYGSANVNQIEQSPYSAWSAQGEMENSSQDYEEEEEEPYSRSQTLSFDEYMKNVQPYEEPEPYEKSEQHKKVDISSSEGTSKGDNDRSSSLLEKETIEERIKRMKSGSLTNEEKEAFLNMALSRTSSLLSNPRTLIRQQPPSDTKAYSSYNTPSASPGSKKMAPAPFPSDSLWNTVIGAGNEKTQEILNKSMKNSDDNKSGSTTVFSDSSTMDEAQKRAWFNMITSPDRFASFSANKKVQPTADPYSQIDYELDPPDLMTTNSEQQFQQQQDQQFQQQQQQQFQQQQQLFQQQQQLFQQQQQQQQMDENYLRDIPDNYPESADNVDLAARLEQAAIMQEKAAADARLRREQERNAAMQIQQEQQRKLKLLAKQREEELLRQQQEVMELKRQEELRLKKIEEQKKSLENERMKQLMQAQEEYWRKKLENEEKKKLAVLTKEEREALEERNKLLKEEEEKRKQSEEEKIHEQYEDNPNKSGVVQRTTMKEDMSQNQPEEETNVGSPKTRDEISSVVSLDNFSKEQSEKKNALDEMLDWQRQQMNSLSSPLPSPSRKTEGVRPIINTSPPQTIPSPSPTFNIPPAPSSSAPNAPRSLNPNIIKQENTIPIGKSESPKIPVVDWSTLGNQNSSPASSTTISSSKSNDNSNLDVGKNMPSPSPSPRLSLREMTMFKGNTNTAPKEQTTNANRNTSSPLKSDMKEPIAKTPIRQQTSLGTSKTVDNKGPKSDVDTSAPARKGPIRMQIFSGDNDEDDDDDTQQTKEVTKKKDIPDDQKAKAKSWGINLDLLK